jgi:arginine utilization protein RocB
LKASDLAKAISSHRYAFSDEEELHERIGSLLARLGITFTHEAALSDVDRVDFLVGRCAVEVKVAHSRAEVLRQLHRYAASDQVDAIILVTTKARHLSMPAELHGKPVHVASLLEGSF